MMALLARHILWMLIRHVHTERPVNRGPGGRMPGLNRVISIKLLSWVGIRVSIVLINVITLLEAIVWRESSVSGRGVDSTRAVRCMSVTFAGF
jgi:hypothetical protein